jgi:hypothetical protein
MITCISSLLWELVATAAERDNGRWERPTLAFRRRRFIRFLSSVHVNRIGRGQQRLSRTILGQIGLMQNESVYSLARSVNSRPFSG